MTTCDNSGCVPQVVAVADILRVQKRMRVYRDAVVRLTREKLELLQWQASTRDYLNQILDDPGVQQALDALTHKLNAPIREDAERRRQLEAAK